MSRDGSLISKKQEQWAKERAERSDPWFPFGRPGCGSPNKKTEKAPSSRDNSFGQSFSESQHEESRRHRSRSRKRHSRDDRSRSTSRRRHRHHKKKDRRHRSRSSSVVHVNPFFSAGSSYNVENELRQEIYLAQTRASALESDNSTLRTQYALVKHQLEQLNANAGGADQKLKECQARAANIERTNHQLRAQVNGQALDMENLKKRMNFYEVEKTAHKERVTELEKRNETVVKKCEELTARCRGLQMERDEAYHNVCVVKQQVADTKKALEGKGEEIAKVQKQMKESGEREKKLKEEKADLEKKNLEKEVQMTAERRRFAQEHRKNQEMIGQLTEKLKAECQKADVEEQFRVVMGTLLGIEEHQKMQIEELQKRLSAVHLPVTQPQNEAAPSQETGRPPPPNPLIPSGLCYVNPFLSYQTPFNMSSSLPPYPPMYMYNSLPQGAVPIQMMPDSFIREAMCPVTALQNMAEMNHSYYPAQETCSTRSEVTVNRMEQRHEPVGQSNQFQIQSPQYTQETRCIFDDPLFNSTSSTRSNSARNEEESERKMEEQRRQQMEKEEEERMLAEEREEEIRQSMEKRHEAVLKALEKAQQEAAILKKAKLHRHVLEDAEEKERLEETLGVDSGKVEEALKQISQIEKQQKLEWESQKQRRSSLQKKKDVNDNHLPTTKSTMRSRSSSIGGNSLDENLNKTFSVERENKGKENIEIRSHSPPESEGDNFRRTRSLRHPPSRMPASVSMGQATSITNPLFVPISTRSRRMRTSHDGPLVAADTENLMTVSKAENIQSPIPKILVETERHTLSPQREDFLSRMRSRSAVSSPSFSSPLSSSVYARKLAEKGCTNHDEDRLSPDIRRREEVNLSRQSSMASLRGSLLNLRGSSQNLASPADSPNLGKYRSMNPTYRSLNFRKPSERQKETLERLTRLREELRAKENYYERPLNGSSHSIRP